MGRLAIHRGGNLVGPDDLRMRAVVVQRNHVAVETLLQHDRAAAGLDVLAHQRMAAVEGDVAELVSGTVVRHLQAQGIVGVEHGGQLAVVVGQAGLSGERKAFLYLPFMHSESLDDQERSVALYAALRDRYVYHLKEKVLEPFLGNVNFRRALKDLGSEDFRTYDAKIQADVRFLIANLCDRFGYNESSAREVCLYVVDHNLAEEFAE